MLIRLVPFNYPDLNFFRLFGLNFYYDFFSVFFVIKIYFVLNYDIDMENLNNNKRYMLKKIKDYFVGTHVSSLDYFSNTQSCKNVF